MSGYHIENNSYRISPILKIETESSTVKTFTFKDDLCAKAKPGQFLMLWIPGIDEIPLSILDTSADGTVSVIVRKVGKATQTLHRKKVGETIGLRGPFGNSFTPKKDRVLIVGGGTGIAPLFFLVKQSLLNAEKLVFVIGAKTKEELLLIDKLHEICGKRKLVTTTEDGSYGIKCLATAPLQKLLAKAKFDMIYTCGPEKMMRKVYDLAEKNMIPLEASLERLMRCAIGLCGSCVVGKYRVCTDGPVFTTKQLREVKSEFGISKRVFNGKKMLLE